MEKTSLHNWTSSLIPADWALVLDPTTQESTIDIMLNNLTSETEGNSIHNANPQYGYYIFLDERLKTVFIHPEESSYEMSLLDYICMRVPRMLKKTNFNERVLICTLTNQIRDNLYPHVFTPFGENLIRSLDGSHSDRLNNIVDNGLPICIFTVRMKEAMFSITDAIYFSYITLTTTGYGDIKPGLDHAGKAKYIVIFENIFEVVFLTLCFGFLISIRDRCKINGVKCPTTQSSKK